MSTENLGATPVGATPAEAPTGATAPSTSTPGAPSATPGAPAGAGASEALHEIKWNGQTQKLPLSKVLELASKGFDYTQKTQQFGAKEREWQTRQTQYERAIGEVRQFLSDRAKVKAYYDAMAGQDPAAAGDPSDLLTAQQAQELFQRQALAQRQEFARELARVKEEIGVQVMAGGYAEKINSAINGLLQSHPELRTIPRVQQSLKDDVAARNPGTLEEAQSILTEIASQYAEGVRGYFAEQQKTVAAGAAPLSRGIEPPGIGAPPAPAPLGQTPRNMNSKEFRELVLADLQGLFKKDG